MRRSMLIGSILLALTGAAATHPAAYPSAVHPYEAPPLPETLADAGDGSQLITAQAADAGATTGTLSWWSLRAGSWVKSGSAPARFGAKGLAEANLREQSTGTTPTGLYDLPYAFGIKAAPPGTRYPYRQVNSASWWCEDNAADDYNRWVEPRPADCRAAKAEHLVSYPAQYARALVIGFNYDRPVHGRGAGIFLHVNGRGATAGCVSVPADAMDRILAWANPADRPHIAIGTRGGPTALTRY
jgi:L,D-peptidoglycan transpeptidase YkuD (ErfK/YbiS/YcfS/YnhG family)